MVLLTRSLALLGTASCVFGSAIPAIAGKAVERQLQWGDYWFSLFAYQMSHDMWATYVPGTGFQPSMEFFILQLENSGEQFVDNLHNLVNPFGLEIHPEQRSRLSEVFSFVHEVWLGRNFSSSSPEDVLDASPQEVWDQTLTYHLSRADYMLNDVLFNPDYDVNPQFRVFAAPFYVLVASHKLQLWYEYVRSAHVLAEEAVSSGQNQTAARIAQMTTDIGQMVNIMDTFRIGAEQNAKLLWNDEPIFKVTDHTDLGKLCSVTCQGEWVMRVRNGTSPVLSRTTRIGEHKKTGSLFPHCRNSDWRKAETACKKKVEAFGGGLSKEIVSRDDFQERILDAGEIGKWYLTSEYTNIVNLMRHLSRDGVVHDGTMEGYESRPVFTFTFGCAVKLEMGPLAAPPRPEHPGVLVPSCPK